MLGADAATMRAKSVYVLRVTAWASVLLGLRFPFLATILVTLVSRLFVTAPLFLLWLLVCRCVWRGAWRVRVVVACVSVCKFGGELKNVWLRCGM